MRRHRKRKRNQSEFSRTGELDQLLDSFQALDRTVVELFMHVYQTPVEDQTALRVQNQQLHTVISKPLLRLLAHEASVSRRRQSLR